MPGIYSVALLMDLGVNTTRSFATGIAQYCNLKGPWRIFREPVAHYKPFAGYKSTLSRLKAFGPDGIILIEDVKDNNEEIIHLGVPIIIPHEFSYLDPKIPTINSNCIATGKMAAEHLLYRGFCNFAYCGFPKRYWSKEREIGFCQHIANYGFDTHVYRPKIKIKNYWESEQPYLIKWLRSLPKPVALMACNDDRGQQVIEACILAGLHVPEDVAVIGSDNDDYVCNLTNPTLSSVARNIKRAGFEMAKLLDRLMNGEKMDGQKIYDSPTHVVTRQSTDILNIEDRDVAQAIGFIRTYAKKGIGVTDVVNAVSLSRRVLEKRFREILDHSIHDEIARVRISEACKMLTETPWPVSQIAYELGYSEASELSRSFRKNTGFTPTSYREKYGYSE